MKQPQDALPIYIVEDDVALADHLALELCLREYDARAVYGVTQLQKKLEVDHSVGALIVDINFPEAVSGGIELVRNLRANQNLQVPVIFISASDDFATRLDVIRVNGDAFFSKPFDTNLLIEKLESLLGETTTAPLRILVVDDDVSVGEVVGAILEEAGLSARVIQDPRRTIDEVLEFAPDLVLLDFHMQHVSGTEVARVMRQHETCCDVPILFLSAETDPNVRAEALNIGVDDFLIKPVNHDYLIAAVVNRAQRARALDTKIYRDSLTHLLVHDAIKNQLADHIAASERHGRQLTYAIADIDDFKKVNDSHGHLTGDHVIKSVASLLRRSCRRSDLLGRYGGEEFVIIMPDTSLDDAVTVIDRIREEFASIAHISTLDGAIFHATFSAGISSYPTFSDVESIQSMADQALYQAKQTGKNRVCVAGNE